MGLPPPGIPLLEECIALLSLLDSNRGAGNFRLLSAIILLELMTQSAVLPLSNRRLPAPGLCPT